MYQYESRGGRHDLCIENAPIVTWDLCTAIPKLDGDQILRQDWGWHVGPLWHRERGSGDTSTDTVCTKPGSSHRNLLTKLPSRCHLSFIFLQNHQKIVKSYLQHDFHISFLRKSMTTCSWCGLRKTCWQDKNKISFNVQPLNEMFSWEDEQIQGDSKLLDEGMRLLTGVF